MYLYKTDDEWLTDACLTCGSVNHIFLARVDAAAWECWSCFNRWWLDDLAQDMFLIDHAIDIGEANNMLVAAHPSIIFVHGHAERA